MTGAANGQLKRFDLDAAAKAAAKESAAVPFAFTYKGESYEVPGAMAWPLEAQRHISRGNLDEALPMLLGADQLDRLMTAGITMGELMLLFNAIGEDAGMGGLPNLPQPVPQGSTPT